MADLASGENGATFTEMTEMHSMMYSFVFLLCEIMKILENIWDLSALKC